MVRPISWLHISDIHMRPGDAWSQDVVLASMCKQIEHHSREGLFLDFILITGDLAFSGKDDEYELVAGFLDALRTASGVPRERIFCVPGNHDIDRDRQRMCFLGTRTYLQNQNRIDEILHGGNDLETLLQRQEQFRKFQLCYFAGQDRIRTAECLAYVSWLTIEDVRLAIVGLDSAWLSQGGSDDHGKLIVGERQVINAMQLVQTDDVPPHVVISMVHHPLHLLQDFDRPRVMNRVEDLCHFVHCGHLHEPETRTTLSDTGACLTLAAGALYNTRESPNTYSLMMLDLLHGVCSVTTHQYEPTSGIFSFESTEKSSIEATPVDICSLGELAEAMTSFDDEIAPWAFYLSALLLEQKAELPVLGRTGYTLASFSVLQGEADSDLKRKTTAFLTLRNALRVLYRRVALQDILTRHGIALSEYGAVLRTACQQDSALRDRLDAQDIDARQLARTLPETSRSHTWSLFSELADAQDWLSLREHASRHISSTDFSTAVLARRMLALSLANSEECTDINTAIEMYEAMAEDGTSEASDIGNLIVLLCDAQAWDRAKRFVISGMEGFLDSESHFVDLGEQIVADTGDKEFRDYLKTAARERDNDH